MLSAVDTTGDGNMNSVAATASTGAVTVAGAADAGGNDNEAAVGQVEQEDEQHEFTVIVCHGNVIRYMAMRALQLPPEAWYLYMNDAHASATASACCLRHPK